MEAQSLAVIPFNLVRRKGVRGVSIAVKRDGSCRVTAPPNVALRDIHALVEGRAGWIMQARQKMMAAPPSIMDIGNAHDYAKHKYAALKLVLERVAYWNAFYKFSYSHVAIKNMKSRWGSCSNEGKLTFTYRLVLLPPELVDYVVVHELSHLAVFNHSAAFWKTVARALPHYKELKKALRCV